MLFLKPLSRSRSVAGAHIQAFTSLSLRIQYISKDVHVHIHVGVALVAHLAVWNSDLNNFETIKSGRLSC